LGDSIIYQYHEIQAWAKWTVEPFGLPVGETCSHLSGSCIACFIFLICLNFYNRALPVCNPLSYEVWRVAVKLLKYFSLF